MPPRCRAFIAADVLLKMRAAKRAEARNFDVALFTRAAPRLPSPRRLMSDNDLMFTPMPLSRAIYTPSR